MIERYFWKFYPEQMIQLDFLSAGLVLGYRHYSRRSEWLGHLRRCRDRTSSWIQKARRRSSRRGLRVLVLGSGWLQDLSVVDLKAHDELYLADANPLSPLINWWNLRNRVTNVKSVVGDVTGTLEFAIPSLHQNFSALKGADTQTLLQFFEHFHDEISTFQKTSSEINKLLKIDPDLVISLNILSQLHLPWQDHLAALLKRLKLKTTSGAGQDCLASAVAPLATNLVDSHLELLNTFSTRGVDVGLICDLAIYTSKGLVTWPQDIDVETDYSRELEQETELVYAIDFEAVGSKSGLLYKDCWWWHLRHPRHSWQQGKTHLVGSFETP